MTRLMPPPSPSSSGVLWKTGGGAEEQALLVQVEEEVELEDLEVEFMELVRVGFHHSPALVERMREVMRRRHVLFQNGRGKRKKKKGGGDRGRGARRGFAGADVSGSLLFGVLVSLAKFFCGDSPWRRLLVCFRIPFLRWTQFIRQSSRLGGFTHFQRDRGPRILRSILAPGVALGVQEIVFSPGDDFTRETWTLFYVLSVSGSHYVGPFCMMTSSLFSTCAVHPAVTCRVSASPRKYKKPGHLFDVCIAGCTQENWIAVGVDSSFFFFAYSALLDSGYTLTLQSTEFLPKFTHLLVVSIGCHLGGSVRLVLGALCFPRGCISVGSDFGWIP